MIKVADLKKYFYKRSFLGSSKDAVKAVDGVSFNVAKGQTFGLVGESGSGKTTVARAIVGIIKPDSGSITLGGDIDIVFQDPFGSLNPRMKVRDIVGESLFVRGLNRRDVEKRVRETIELVKLDSGESMEKYPHQFSGGERQRIAIARALIRRPDILVLDEPVSSLDVSIQAAILNLLKDIKDELALTYVFISHDLRVVEFMSDIVAVMKDGRLAELASREELYKNPKSDYTKELLSSIPEF